MESEDYLLKQLNRLVAAIAHRSVEAMELRKRAQDLKESGESGQALVVLEEALEQCCGLTPALYASLAAATIAHLLALSGDRHLLLDAADILRDKSAIHSESGDVAGAAKAMQVVANLAGRRGDRQI